MAGVTGSYLPTVVGAVVLREYVLRMLFDDGTVGDVDFSAETWTGVLEPLSDPRFLRRSVTNPEAGTITWPGDLDMAPEPLYERLASPPRHCLRASGPRRRRQAGDFGQMSGN